MTHLTGHWSNFAVLKGFRFSIAGSPGTQPTAFNCALYSNNADPDSGATPAEVTDSGYSQQGPISMTEDDTAITNVNTGDIDFGPFASSTVVAGIALVDNGSGEIMWWANFSTPQTLPAGTGVSVPAGDFIVKEVP